MRDAFAIAGANANYLALLLTIVSMAFAGVWSLFQFLIQNWIERRRENQHRETHNLNLFKALADQSNDRLQLAAAAVLIERLHGYRRASRLHDEGRTIIRALISILKDRSQKTFGDTEAGTPGVSPDLSKFIVEQVVGYIARLKTSDGGVHPIMQRDLDWQMVTIHNAYLKGLVAPRVDFYGAKFYSVGLRNATLDGCVFNYAEFLQASSEEGRLGPSCVLAGASLKDARFQFANLSNTDLTGADLRGADLTKANLQGAVLRHAKIDGAIIDGATLLDADLVGVIGQFKTSVHSATISISGHAA